MIGAGARGIGVYGEYSLHHQNEIKFIGVAEPDPERRLYFSFQHNIKPDHQYNDFQEILSQEKMAEVCFICTQDNMHVEPAVMAMEKGYHVFLEKPMAVTPEDCIMLAEIAEKHHVKIMIGHVLRYTPFFAQIKQWLDDQKIGRLMSIQHNENVAYWHQAHSYVRGNWRNKALSSPMILAKSCHDMDLMLWLVKSKAKKIASFGELSYFKTAEAPQSTPRYCLDGCKEADTCLYYAPKVYLKAPIWMKLPVSNNMSDESLLLALKQGPYGRCVYHCDNDVVDHQVTIIEFENEVTVAFTMTAFTKENTRTIKLMGTKGEIRGHLDKNELELIRFGENPIETMTFKPAESGHGGGDVGIMQDFVKLIDSDAVLEKASFTDSVDSHLLAFAAELSRNTSQVVDFSLYLESLKSLSYHKLQSDELDSAIRLCSTVFNENMLDQFPLMLGESNRERMFVATLAHKVRSMVNYYPSTIQIDKSKIAVGSIGSVCTEPVFRNRNIATKLLEMAEAEMVKENIRLAIISGTGPLYEHFGATRVGNVTGYRLDLDNTILDNEYGLHTFAEADFETLKKIYEQEKIKYIRSDAEFKALIKGQTYPGSTALCHLELIKKNKETVAYVFVKKPSDSGELLVREIGGDRLAVAKSLPALIRKHKRSYCLVPVDSNDQLNQFLQEFPSQETDQHASFKVINWVGFFADLAPYLNSFGKISLSLDKTNPTVTVNGNRCELADFHELHKLIFGPNKELLDKLKMTSVLNDIFPIPFVWTNNLSYQ